MSHPTQQAHPHDNHGQTPAAWTGVIICLIASIIIALGVWFDNDLVAIIGGIAFCAGGLIGWAMGRASKRASGVNGSMDSHHKPA